MPEVVPAGAPAWAGAGPPVFTERPFLLAVLGRVADLLRAFLVPFCAALGLVSALAAPPSSVYTKYTFGRSSEIAQAAGCSSGPRRSEPGDPARSSPRLLPGLNRFPANSTLAITHSSIESSYWARSTICWYCSMGMKLSIVRHTILTSFRRSRIVSSMSSLSVWNSCCRSSISCCVPLCLFQSFSNFMVSLDTCSSVDAYFSSKFSFSSAAASNSSCIRFSSRLRSSTSI
mmetsp:Transcript_6056/g.8641  ORF Transcript_6056/g.8641 Transcript_6056/m.8641 type:complete len:231 (-) Transcript_6056:868-1560(-)